MYLHSEKIPRDAQMMICENGKTSCFKILGPVNDARKKKKSRNRAHVDQNLHHLSEEDIQKFNSPRKSKNSTTLPETNIAPESRPSQRESSIPTIHFQGLC